MITARPLLLNSDAAHIPLLDESVHLIVTSPPYYRLRKYAGEQEVAWSAVEYSPMAGLAPLFIPTMRDEARVRLELDRLNAWENGIEANNDNFGGLPIFDFLAERV